MLLELKGANVALLTWSHACTVGVRAMDDQHGILMDTMNELRLAVLSGRGREHVSELLDRLIDFTRMHYWSEERLLEECGFPGLAEHRAAHHRLLAQMLEAAHRLQYGEGGSPSSQQSGSVIGGRDMGAVLDEMRERYVNHTEGLDQQYGPWLNKRGVY